MGKVCVYDFPKCVFTVLLCGEQMDMMFLIPLDILHCVVLMCVLINMHFILSLKMVSLDEFTDNLRLIDCGIYLITLGVWLE